MERDFEQKQGQKSLFRKLIDMAALAVVVGVVVPLVVISIIIEGVNRHKEGLVALLGSMITFAVVAGSGLALSACTLGFDWDQPFCNIDTGEHCRGWQPPEVEVAEDGEDDGETAELPPQCASYEKSCEVEGTLACIDPDTDRMNCGGCGIECSDTQICAQGVCGCPSGKSACGAECYDFLTEVVACGGCGNACAYANAGASCEIGECRMGECLEGSFDCNGEPSDGCESELKDLENCGACGVVCEYSNAVASCDGGMCEFLDCEVGFDDCDDDTSNGCEADLNTDAGNCGGCGTVCGVADPMVRFCLASTCVCLCGNGVLDDNLEKKECPKDFNYIPTCGDGYCHAVSNFENSSTCEADCAIVPQCGFNGCQPEIGENFNNCTDCGDITTVQNDQLCGGVVENCQNSPGDCGQCNTCVYNE